MVCHIRRRSSTPTLKIFTRFNLSEMVLLTGQYWIYATIKLTLGTSRLVVLPVKTAKGTKKKRKNPIQVIEHTGILEHL